MTSQEVAIWYEARATKRATDAYTQGEYLHAL
jgi:hypothetical protein